jgi:hypothetical protein
MTVMAASVETMITQTRQEVMKINQTVNTHQIEITLNNQTEVIRQIVAKHSNKPEVIPHNSHNNHNNHGLIRQVVVEEIMAVAVAVAVVADVLAEAADAVRPRNIL